MCDFVEFFLIKKWWLLKEFMINLICEAVITALLRGGDLI